MMDIVLEECNGQQSKNPMDEQWIDKPETFGWQTVIYFVRIAITGSKRHKR